MSELADIHTHLMPGVDDGSPSLELSVLRIAQMAQLGISDIAVTPHINSFFDPQLNPGFTELVVSRGWGSGGIQPLRFVPQGFAALDGAVREAGIEVRLHQGGELNPRCASDQEAEDLHCIALGPEGRQWILMEVDLYEDFDRRWSEAADHLRSFGYGVVLAHPERAPNIHTASALDRLRGEVSQGVRVQVNTSSLLYEGSAHQRVGLELIAEGLVTCLASDLHPGSREALHSDVAARAADLGLDEETLRQLLGAGPRSLLIHGIG